MDANTQAQIVTAIFTCITGAAGTVIAVMLYRLNKSQQRDAWIKTYKETHEAFWNDPVMANVRSWIAYEQAYQMLRPILQKRRDIEEKRMLPDTLEESEYKKLDELDKFLNLTLRIAAINYQLELDHGQNLWKGLFFDYWLHNVSNENRKELKWYIDYFYPELYEPTVFTEKLAQIKNMTMLSPESENAT